MATKSTRKKVAVKATKPRAAVKAKPKAAKPVRAAPVRKRHLELVGGKDTVVKVPQQPEIETEIEEEIVDTSSIIVNYHSLRAAGTEAMGEYANTAKGAELKEEIKRGKKGVGHIWRVHPLDVHIPQGTKRVNTRDFAEPDMLVRVLEFATGIAQIGVQKPLKVRINEAGLLELLQGETRWRSTMMAWVLKAKGDLDSVPGVLDTIPIVLKEKDTNDLDDVLDIDIDNDNKPLKPIERAMLYRHALRIGGTVEKIAARTGRKATYINSVLKLLELPEVLLNFVSEAGVSVSFVRKAYLDHDKDTDKAVAAIQEAIKTAAEDGADRVMPKHLAPVTVVTGGGGDGGTRTRSSGGRGGSGAKTNAKIANYAALLDAVSGFGADAKVSLTDIGMVQIILLVSPKEYAGPATKISWPVPEAVQELADHDATP